MVTEAVMKKCDTLKEGFLNNPRQCTFDFSTLLCEGADGDNCLTRLAEVGRSLLWRTEKQQGDLLDGRSGNRSLR